MAWRVSVVLRNAATGAPQSGQVVELYSGGEKQGTFSDNADGSYYLVMTTIGSLIGTIKVNGVTQTEYEDIPFIGEDIIDHAQVPSYGGAAVANSIHGILTGEGAIVSEDKVQTLTQKTLDSSCVVDADAVSGALDLANIPTNIPDGRLANIVTAGKCQGSAIQLSATPALENNSGIRVKLPSSNPTLERTADGLEVLLSGTTPGLEKKADGLAFDPTVMAKIETAGKVDPLAIDVNWSSPLNFDVGDDIDDAVAKIDSALYRMRVDRDTPDIRAWMLYTQHHEASRNTAASEASAVTDSAQYFDGDATERRKICVPFNKTTVMNRLVVRAQFNNTGANNSTVKVYIYNMAGSLQKQYTKTESGTSWTAISAVANLGDLSSGFYWVVVSLSGAAGTAQMRGTNIFITNDVFITGEEMYWEAYEGDIA